jgi:hypothetical protein
MVTLSLRPGTLGGAASMDTGDGGSSVASVACSGGDGDADTGGDDGGACADTV